MKKVCLFSWMMAQSEFTVHRFDALDVAHIKIEKFEEEGNYEQVKVWLGVAEVLKIIIQKEQSGKSN